jgi:flagellar protein FliO/FliZ
MIEIRKWTLRVPGGAFRHLEAVSLGVVLAFGAAAPTAGAEPAPPSAALPNPDALARRAFAPRCGTAPRGGGLTGASGGWWLGTAGVALALAVFGAVSLTSRRYLPKGHSGPLRVVGRTSLSPRHTVYLLQVGERVLLVGTGPQGAPSLLGELDDPADLERVLPRPNPPVPAPAVRIDHRPGDDA